MKKVVFWILVSALVMLILPWLAVSFVKGDNGMASISFVLFCFIWEIQFTRSLPACMQKKTEKSCGLFRL